MPHSSTVDTTSFYVVWPRLVTWTIVTGVPDRLPDEGTTRRECPILSPAYKHFFPFFFFRFEAYRIHDTHAGRPLHGGGSDSFIEGYVDTTTDTTSYPNVLMKMIYSESLNIINLDFSCLKEIFITLDKKGSVEKNEDSVDTSYRRSVYI